MALSAEIDEVAPVALPQEHAGNDPTRLTPILRGILAVVLVADTST